MEYLHSDITGEILNAFYDVYNELGYGFLERVYKNALYKELKKRGFDCSTERSIPVYYDYLRATDAEVGLLLNFGPEPQKRRIVFTNDKKKKVINSL